MSEEGGRGVVRRIHTKHRPVFGGANIRVFHCLFAVDETRAFVCFGLVGPRSGDRHPQKDDTIDLAYSRWIFAKVTSLVILEGREGNLL